MGGAGWWGQEVSRLAGARCCSWWRRYSFNCGCCAIYSTAWWRWKGGFKTKSGEIYNELPDRFADVVILAGAGYSLPGMGSPWLQTLGWMAAALAVITAYVRALGAAAGTTQYFIGPMAKPQRMAVMTVTCLVLAVLSWRESLFDLMQISLLLICAGCLVTIARRVIRIVKELESK
jgi:phosphatidylglycerophosphate synthase